jgi:phage tail tape-measure protein
MNSEDKHWNDKTTSRDENRDPLSGAPGAHPVGTGVGAVAGGVATGAAVGTVAGPVGTGIGAAVGAIVGGLIGKGVAEGIDPTAEDAYWRDEYATRPYVRSGAAYDAYAPAYRYGWESRARYHDRSWDDAEDDLRRDWERNETAAGMRWDEAKLAVRDAWDRITDRDGR